MRTGGKSAVKVRKAGEEAPLTNAPPMTMSVCLCVCVGQGRRGGRVVLFVLLHLSLGGLLVSPQGFVQHGPYITTVMQGETTAALTLACSWRHHAGKRLSRRRRAEPSPRPTRAPSMGARKDN